MRPEGVDLTPITDAIRRAAAIEWSAWRHGHDFTHHVEVRRLGEPVWRRVITDEMVLQMPDRIIEEMIGREVERAYAPIVDLFVEDYWATT